MKRVLCIPFEPLLGKTRRNAERLLALAGEIAGAAGAACDVVVLPELALSGYLLESLVAEAAMTEEEITALALGLTETGMPARTEWVLGVPLRQGNAVYNVAVVLCEGTIVHMQKKIFLPTYGMFDEGRYFGRGREFSAYTGALGKTAVLICEDAWHMEMAYAAAETAAETVVVISASPARGYAAGESFDSTLSWRARLKTFAASYGQNFLYCNRGGTEDGVLFDGTSFALDASAAFIQGETSATPVGAALFSLPVMAERHTGFVGNSARQNDLPLFSEILEKLRQ